MISAIVLAAGQSRRMGLQKMLLPWGQTTVIGKVISTLLEAGVSDIHIVTGETDSEIKKVLAGRDVTFVFNPQYENGEMLNSIQVGLENITGAAEAILIVLGDQPQIETQVIEMINERYQSTKQAIIVPSYKMHRGHPWLLGKVYWTEIFELKPPQTLQGFLNDHTQEIEYVIVDTPSVLQDLDTQKDYFKHKP